LASPWKPSTLLRCEALAYAPLIERRLRTFRKPHCGSIRIDETYIKIRGQWRYLYRAIDKHGTPVDFLLTAKRDLDAAKRFFRKMLKEEPLLAPDRIGTDGAGSYPPAIAESRKAGLLARTPVHYVTKHLQQGIESDHFRVKRPMPRIGGFTPLVVIPIEPIEVSRIDEHLIRAGEAGLTAQVEPHRAGLGQVGGPDMMLNLIPFIRRQHRPKRAVDADEAVKVATPVLVVEARRLVDHEE
jgi:DDE domain